MEKVRQYNQFKYFKKQKIKNKNKIFLIKIK